MTDITPKRFAEIKALAEAATAGQWKPIAQGGSSTIVSPTLPVRNDRRSAVPYGYREGEGYCIGYPFLYQSKPFDEAEQTRMDFVCFSHADAAFIAAARQDIPDLIAALEAAQAENAKLREAMTIIAMQRLPAEIASDVRTNLDFEEGYSACVETARAALEPKP